MDAQYNGSNAINTLAAFLRCLSHVAVFVLACQ